MMIKMSPKLQKFISSSFDINDPIQKWLLQSWLIVQNQAKLNAPFDTGTLRRSITMNTNNLKRWYVIIGSPVVYSRRREFENYKNPQTLYYLKRGYEMNKTQIVGIIKTALQNYL